MWKAHLTLVKYVNKMICYNVWWWVIASTDKPDSVVTECNFKTISHSKSIISKLLVTEILLTIELLL